MLTVRYGLLAHTYPDLWHHIIGRFSVASSAEWPGCYRRRAQANHLTSVLVTGNTAARYTRLSFPYSATSMRDPLADDMQWINQLTTIGVGNDRHSGMPYAHLSDDPRYSHTYGVQCLPRNAEWPPILGWAGPTN